jgi:polar amino acid transport system substrate-binding protein
MITKRKIIESLGLIILVLAWVFRSYTATPIKPVLKVATDASFKPFEYYDDDNQLTGFDVELLESIADLKGYKLSWANVQFDGLISGIIANNFDLAISAITITEERAKKVSFTKGYYNSGLSVITHKDNNTIIGFDKSLKGLKVGAKIGTTEATIAAEQGANVIIYNDTDTMALSLVNDKIEALVSDAPWNRYYLTSKEAVDLKEVGDMITPEEWGIVINLNNKTLLKDFDDGLKQIKANGTYQKLINKYFGK